MAIVMMNRLFLLNFQIVLESMPHDETFFYTGSCGHAEDGETNCSFQAESNVTHLSLELCEERVSCGTLPRERICRASFSRENTLLNNRVTTFFSKGYCFFSLAS